MAQNIGLDMEAFNSCYQSKRYASEIQADINQAISLGLNRTPSILVNGVVIDSFANLTEIIDAALAGQ
jgi:protein-disulfide isomerase